MIKDRPHLKTAILSIFLRTGRSVLRLSEKEFVLYPEWVSFMECVFSDRKDTDLKLNCFPINNIQGGLRDSYSLRKNLSLVINYYKTDREKNQGNY